ncbi:MAG TPA: glycosyltransferase family 2 protein [Stellaceae bacterium]|nr:glycosyltransferase family 2 protein [Stellaceae bacterium]
MSGGRPLISAVVVAHNEEAQLAECLKTVGFCDEVVVVLDRCTDKSKDIARLFQARIIEGAWEREGPRRHAGIDACTGAWVLEVDADERIPQALAEEIRRTAEHSTVSWHLIPVDNYIGDRLVRYGWGASFGKGAFAGFYRHGAKRWGDERVHPEVTLSGSQGPTFNGRLTHYVDRDISDMLARLNRYTTARAKDLRESGNIGSYRRNVRRIFTRFWKCYIARQGYREGPYGFLIALCAGLYPILSYLKARLEKE